MSERLSDEDQFLLDEAERYDPSDGLMGSPGSKMYALAEMITRLRSLASRLSESLATAERVGDGWVLVPRELNAAMWSAANRAGMSIDRMNRLWEALLLASHPQDLT